MFEIKIERNVKDPEDRSCIRVDQDWDDKTKYRIAEISDDNKAYYKVCLTQEELQKLVDALRQSGLVT